MDGFGCKATELASSGKYCFESLSIRQATPVCREWAVISPVSCGRVRPASLVHSQALVEAIYVPLIV